jgi:hypothetical protein
MKATYQTTLSEILRENPSVIELLTKIDPSFKRLGNPFFKLLVSPFMTIEITSKFFKVHTREIYKVLYKSGFEIDNKLYCPTCDDDEEEEERDFEKVLDIRKGARPEADFTAKILSELSSLEDEKTMLIISSNQPFDIVKNIENLGFEIQFLQKEKDLVYTYFKKVNTPITIPHKTPSDH